MRDLLLFGVLAGAACVAYRMVSGVAVQSSGLTSGSPAVPGSMRSIGARDVLPMSSVATRAATVGWSVWAPPSAPDPAPFVSQYDSNVPGMGSTALG